MTYQLLNEEKLPDGLKRAAVEQMDKALAYLTSPGEDLDTAVHESRKCFKRIRAVLRLARPEIGEAMFRQENVCFRDAGRMLAELRDSVVMVRTLDGVLAEFEASIASEGAALRERLVAEYQAVRRQMADEGRALADEGRALAKAAALVEEARQRAARWPIEDETFTAVAISLRQIYRRGQKRLAAARLTPTAETLHEWRKRVKDLWYALSLLFPEEPRLVTVMTEEADTLAEALGDEHDLARLQAALSDDSSSQALADHINQKRAALQTQAFRQGHIIYAESPKAFIKRLQVYWAARGK